MAEATGSVRALNDSDDGIPARSGVHSRPRAITSALAAAGMRNASPSWLLIALLLGGGGGSAIGANIFSDDAAQADATQALARISAIEGRLDVVAAQQQESAADAAKLERRLLRSQTRTLQWIGEVLIKQSEAIGALASAAGVKVDVSVPPLMPDGDEF